MGELRLMNFLEMTLPTLVILSQTDVKAQPEYALASKLDFKKVGLFLDGTWPVSFPEFHLLGESPKGDAWWWKIAKRAKYVVVDVETERLPKEVYAPEYSGKIIQIGLYPAGGVPCIWDRIIFPDYETTFLANFKELIK